MRSKWIAAAIGGTALALGGAAQAYTIEYVVHGLGTGYVDSPAHAFSKIPFEVVAYADSTTFTDDTTDDAFLIAITSADLIGPLGATHAIVVAPDTYFVTPDIGGVPEAAVATGTPGDLTPDALFYGPKLSGYDGLDNLGPILVAAGFEPLTLAGGNTVDFTKFSIASFTAYAPEPAAWALMTIGLGAVGGCQRRRRATGAVAVA